MRNTITVMNAKGGVGKSTLVLALAETLSACHDKDVLVIDADAQASVSHLLMRQPELEAAQSGGRTIVDYLTGAVLKESTASWREFVTAFAKLAPTQREALLLAVLEGLPYEVIASHTGVSVGTVKSRISRARDTLERLLLEGDVKPRPATGAELNMRRDTADADEVEAQDR
jgi:DNA-directed RNA polymerase specialized sigma24 family protein